MLKEYDIEKLNPRKNPYAEELKKQARESGIQNQTQSNLDLVDCEKKISG